MHRLLFLAYNIDGAMNVAWGERIRGFRVAGVETLDGRGVNLQEVSMRRKWGGIIDLEGWSANPLGPASFFPNSKPFTWSRTYILGKFYYEVSRFLRGGGGGGGGVSPLSIFTINKIGTYFQFSNYHLLLQNFCLLMFTSTSHITENNEDKEIRIYYWNFCKKILCLVFFNWFPNKEKRV